MAIQILSRAQSTAAAPDLRPWNLIEWQNSSSGTQWERFRDSGSASAARSFAASPFHKLRLSIVAALVVVAVAALWAVIGAWRHPSQIVTAPGEHRQLVLADGSVVDMKPDSQARIALNAQERRVILAHGAARISVAGETERPFLLSTSEATFETIGAVLDVQASKDETAIIVREGRVIIQPPLIDAHSGAAYSPPRLLTAGERALVTGEGEIWVQR